MILDEKLSTKDHTYTSPSADGYWILRLQVIWELNEQLRSSKSLIT